MEEGDPGISNKQSYNVKDAFSCGNAPTPTRLRLRIKLVQKSVSKKKCFIHSSQACMSLLAVQVLNVGMGNPKLFS